MMYVIEIPTEIIDGILKNEDLYQHEPESDLETIKQCLKVGLRQSASVDWDILDQIIVEQVQQSETFGEYVQYRTPRIDMMYRHRKNMWDALVNKEKNDGIREKYLRNTKEA